MYFVYILRSQKESKRLYIGRTENLEERLKDHNCGDSVYTNKFRPWVLETHVVFSNKTLAERFERYLKSGSGHAFLKKRFLPSCNNCENINSDKLKLVELSRSRD